MIAFLFPGMVVNCILMYNIYEMMILDGGNLK